MGIFYSILLRGKYFTAWANPARTYLAAPVKSRQGGKCTYSEHLLGSKEREAEEVLEKLLGIEGGTAAVMEFGAVRSIENHDLGDSTVMMTTMVDDRLKILFKAGWHHTDEKVFSTLHRWWRLRQLWVWWLRGN